MGGKGTGCTTQVSLFSPIFPHFSPFPPPFSPIFPHFPPFFLAMGTLWVRLWVQYPPPEAGTSEPCTAAFTAVTFLTALCDHGRGVRPGVVGQEAALPPLTPPPPSHSPSFVGGGGGIASGADVPKRRCRVPDFSVAGPRRARCGASTEARTLIPSHNRTVPPDHVPPPSLSSAIACGRPFVKLPRRRAAIPRGAVPCPKSPRRQRRQTRALLRLRWSCGGTVGLGSWRNPPSPPQRSGARRARWSRR